MRGDWCTVSRYDPEHCAPYFPVPEQIISYHYVRKGHAFFELADGQVVEGREGMMILSPRNDEHLVYSKPGLEPQDFAEVTQRHWDGNPSVIRVEAEGPETSLYCGWLGVLSGKHPLLEALPPVMAIDAANDWIESNLGNAAGELQQDAVLVAKLSEFLFAKAVRRYVDGLGPTDGGWLAGLKDPGVARALGIIHRCFAEELDVDEIARAAGLSRTVLRDRFVELLGEPPMRYCAKWRMRAAPNMLRDGKDNSANIAYAVGFNSEAAFNRAFKREFGEPPANWRRRQKAEQAIRDGQVLELA